ncbi:S-adenosyl-L-methionine-dependent tRNA 4-demethylwyosine synthase, partial [Biomphalaria glabrata]
HRNSEMLEKIFQHHIGTAAWHIPLWTILAAGLGAAYLIYRRGEGQSFKKSKSSGVESPKKINQKQKRQIKIFVGSQTGKGKKLADILKSTIEAEGYSTSVLELSPSYDHESLFSLEAEEGSIIIFLISTYTEGKPPDSAKDFYMWLEDAAEDFRVTKATLDGLHYAVVGLGNSSYPEHFNSVAKNVDAWLHTLSGNRVLPLCLADENVVNSKNKGLEEDFNAWMEASLKSIKRAIHGRQVTAKNCEDTCTKQCSCKTKKENGEAGDGKCSSDEEDTCEESDEESTPAPKHDVMDLEDLGNMMKQSKEAKLMNGGVGNQGGGDGPREMITPLLRDSLEKQGYKLIGSHSGVKLCRWTKSMLRGRGGCYKHTFYGIESHRCMETTPSLACANKCVFCW